MKYITILLLALSTAPLHDYYYTRCIVAYRPDQQALQVSLYLFLDDIEHALAEQGHKRLRLCSRWEAPEADSLLSVYIRDHLQLSIPDSTELDMQYLGKEIDNDFYGLWCYLYVKDLPALTGLEIKNTLLLEMIEEQKNEVEIEAPGFRKAMLFHRDKRSGEVNW